MDPETTEQHPERDGEIPGGTQQREDVKVQVSPPLVPELMVVMHDSTTLHFVSGLTTV